jgi:hypothetical protein
MATAKRVLSKAESIQYVIERVERARDAMVELHLPCERNEQGEYVELLLTEDVSDWGYDVQIGLVEDVCDLLDMDEEEYHNAGGET